MVHLSVRASSLRSTIGERGALCESTIGERGIGSHSDGLEALQYRCITAPSNCNNSNTAWPL